MAVGVPPRAFAGEAGKEVPCLGENAERPLPLVAVPGCEEEIEVHPPFVFTAAGGLFSKST